MNQPNRIKLQVWLVISLVFVLGAVTGASLDRFYLANATKEERPGHGSMGGPSIDRMVARMTKDLSLSAQQADEIRKIFEDSRKGFKLQDCPGFKESRQRTRERINAVLTPEQRKRNDEIIAQREAERGARMNESQAPK